MTRNEVYDAGSNIMFSVTDDNDDDNASVLRIDLFETDLTMFNSVIQATTYTIGVTQRVDYENGDAVIRFFTMAGDVVDLDTLENVMVIIF